MKSNAISNRKPLGWLVVFLASLLFCSPAVAQPSWVNVSLQSDQYGGETSWDIVSVSTGMIVESSPPIYGDTFTETLVTLPAGVYTFIIYDSYGDGFVVPSERAG